MTQRRTAKYPIKEWNLLIGAPVEITRWGTLVRIGIVEDAMPDSSLLWVALRVRLERYQRLIASPFNRVGREPGIR